MNALAILRAGPATSVQDAGRQGFLRYGVTPAGPMDWIAHRTANILAGNPSGGAAIEIGPGGLIVTAEGGPLSLGISAGGFRVSRDGSALPTRAAVTLAPGSRLEIAPGRSRLWAYLSPAGGFAVAPVMGSFATHQHSGIGPFGGGWIASGMVLPVATPARAGAGEAGLFDPDPPAEGPIRFIPGPQDDYFTADALALFASQTYRVAARSDRMAFRLAGPSLAHAKGHDIVSDGIAMGAIQVPGDGLPLILMADRQPTGGYPKLGTVIRADLPRLAQTRPGEALRFAPVPVAEAVAALRAAIPDPTELRGRWRPMRSVRPGP
ncbi:MAG: biotin-dependent carboxyltransferase family protein [Paracoccaceae bacterium]